MRDYRDAKTMAKGLRRSLAGQGTRLTHSQCLELIAQAFGFDNWNILAAKIEAARPAPAADKGAADETLYCSFCRKSQHDVKTLIAGPNTFICNECVALCDDIVEDNEVERHLRDLSPDADPFAALESHLEGYMAEQLAAYLSRAEERLAKEQKALDEIDGPAEGLPGWLQDKPAADLARIRARLVKQVALQRRSVEVVARVLAARG
jgi:hypothetical protein